MPTLLSEAFPAPIWNKGYYAGATRTNGARWNSLVNPALNKGAHNSGVVMQGPHSFDHHQQQSDVDDLFQQQNNFDRQRLAQQEYLNDLRQLQHARLKLLSDPSTTPSTASPVRSSANPPTQEVSTKNNKSSYMAHVYHLMACEACQRMLNSIENRSNDTGWFHQIDKHNMIMFLLGTLIVVILLKR